LAFFVLGGAIYAPGNACAENTRKLKVGVYESAPFAIKDSVGNWEGIAADLWVAVASENGFLFEFVEVSEEEAVGKLASGELDVIAAGLPIRAETEALVDFSQPFFASDWAIAIMRKPAATLFGSLLKVFLSWQLWVVILGLAALLLLVGLLIWVLERRENKEEFGANPVQAVIYGFYWAVAMMTGAGEKAPKSVYGRLIAIAWIFAGLFVTSTFTASVTTLLSVDHLGRKISSERDLPNAYIAVVRGSCENMLRDMKVRYLLGDDDDECFKMLKSGQVDAVVAGEPTLEHYAARKFRGKLDVIPMNFEEVFYAFGLKPGSRIAEKVNTGILKITSGSGWAGILRRYLED
jgi:ABC-type amino acid transport substrate-binding protein